MDLRFTTALEAAGACNAAGASGDLGVAAARLIVPGDPSRSLVSLRAHAPGLGRMPPLASSVVDGDGLAVLDAWITGMAGCQGAGTSK